MSENSSLPEVSVVICSYSEDRWDRLIGALDSVRTQTVPPKQTIVVVDYNVDLYKRLIFTVPDAVIVENSRTQGSLRRPQHRSGHRQGRDRGLPR